MKHTSAVSSLRGKVLRAGDESQGGQGPTLAHQSGQGPTLVEADDISSSAWQGPSHVEITARAGKVQRWRTSAGKVLRW